MGVYILRRLLYMIPVLLSVSLLSYIIIQLPPGDYLDAYIAQLRLEGSPATQEEIATLRQQFGLDQPHYIRYFKWMWGMLHGDMGRSFIHRRPVTELIGERLLLTMAISFCSILLTYLIAIPIGVYSATHQYSFGDYLFTFLGFIGISIPSFFLALILMFVAYSHFGITITSLFSDEYSVRAWIEHGQFNFGKLLDLFKHLWLPALIVAVAGTAGSIRVLRGCLLDELRKQYVMTARAKGLTERRLTFKYPFRIAINPMISTIGWLLPSIVSGAVFVAIVLNLPTTGPMLLEALMMQDMYLAGSFIMLLCTLTVIGTLISDILLAWVDPRIRYE